MQKTNNQNQKNSPEVVGFRRAVPILLFALAAFIGLCFITQSTGWLGTFIPNVFLGLFSYGAYAIPLLLVLHGIFYFRDLENRCVISRTIFSGITVIAISALSYTIYSYGKDMGFAIGDYYRLGVEGVGGGFIGSIISYALMKIFGSVGMIVIAVAVFALYISFFFAKSKRISGKFLYFLLAVLTSILAFFEKCIMLVVNKIKGVKQRKRQEEIQSKNQEFFGDDFFAVDNGLKELKIEELGIKETRSTASIEANPTLHEKVFHKSAVDDVEQSVHQSSKVSEASYIDSSDKKKKTQVFYDSAAAIIIEDEEINDKSARKETSEQRTSQTSGSASINKLYGLDENAEDVFTSDFDPFDFVTAESLAAKPSSKASLLKQERGISKKEESISSITEDDIKRARELERFEASKRAALEYARRTATPVASTPASSISEVKNVEIKVAESEKVQSAPTGSACSVTIDKLEAQINRQNSVHNPDNENYSLQNNEISSVNSEKYNFTFKKDDDVIEPDISENAASSAPAYSSIDNSGSTLTDKDYASASAHKENTADAADKAQQGDYRAYQQKEYEADDNTEYENAEAEEGVFGINEDFSEPSVDKKADATDPFAPIDYSAADTLDENINDMFKPYTEPSADDLRTAQNLNTHKDVLVTERSMLNTAILDDEYEEDVQTSELEAEAGGYEPEIIPEDERNPEISKLREMFPFLDGGVDDEDTEDAECEPPFETNYTPIIHKEISDIKNAEPKKPEQPKKEEPKKPTFENYVFPPIDLLVKDDTPVQSNDEEIQENANKLIETLASFNVTVSIKGYDRGPRITRYEVVPAAGVKVTQVTNLENDVALALAAGSLRVEAPIPGKSAIGFEIPNKHAETVRLRDLIETNEFASSNEHTTICVGKDVSGCPVISTVEKMPHVLIAGATGMGKSVCINALLISMIYKASPADVRFIMIDPKKVEFKMYDGIPHLLVPIVTDSNKAAGALMWAVEEMERRYDLIANNNVRNIDSYNEKVKKDPSIGEKLARIVIVIDEFADLMLQVRDPVENLVMSLAQKARAAGIHLIIGTQKPTTNVITGVIKSNIPARISCRVSSNVDSRIVLDQSGAEKLLAKGDMLFYMPGMMKPLRTQSAFVSDTEINDIMEFLRQGTDGPAYDTEVLDQINKAAQKCNKNSQSDSDYDYDDDRSSGEGYLNDRKFLDAVEIAVNTGSIATSKLQRKLSIGFSKAAQYIDIMEDLGVVGPPNGPRAREVYMTPDEWHEKLARAQLDD